MLSDVSTKFPHIAVEIYVTRSGWVGKFFNCTTNILADPDYLLA